MKLYATIAVLFSLLVGGGFILLRTNQAPLMSAAEATSTEESPAPVVETAAPVKQILSTEQFRTLGAEVMSSLPTKEALKAEDSAVTSAPIVQAGERLGAIAEAVHDDAALEAEAMVLYETCAASVQYPDSVRALCFFNYKNLGVKAGKEISLKAVPPAIRQLAEKLGN